MDLSTGDVSVETIVQDASEASVSSGLAAIIEDVLEGEISTHVEMAETAIEAADQVADQEIATIQTFVEEQESVAAEEGSVDSESSTSGSVDEAYVAVQE